MESAAIDRILDIAFFVWWFGFVVLIFSLGILAYQKEWLAAMMDQVDRDGVIRQDRINVHIGKSPKKLAHLLSRTPNELTDSKYFQFRSIRSEVRSIRRFTTIWRWIALGWTGLFLAIFSLKVIIRSL